MQYRFKRKFSYRFCAGALVFLHIFMTSGMAHAFTARSSSYVLNSDAHTRAGARLQSSSYSLDAKREADVSTDAALSSAEYALPKEYISSVPAGFASESIAGTAKSIGYGLCSGWVNSGGSSKSSSSYDLARDSVGDSFSGKSQSNNYILQAGFVPVLPAIQLAQTVIIPNFCWQPNETKGNALDLDDYFSSLGGLPVTYTVAGNSNIAVEIDPDTHMVSFAQAGNWFGTEQIIFTATDSENNVVQSNLVTLQVQGEGMPPVLEHIPDITVSEGQLVTITPQATDSDGDPITYKFALPIDSTGHWQTGFFDSGVYNITVKAVDPSGLQDSRQLQVTVTNVNRPPELDVIDDITVNEGNLVTITPQATDPDNEAITYYYGAPLDATGKWLTDYDDSGVYTVTVTASDGIDTVSQTVDITVNDVNRAPQVSLNLNKYTVSPQGLLEAGVTASDPDNGAMTFSLKKDGAEISSGDITAGYYCATTSFSSIGDHTITVTVTDAGGLSVTETKGVDVVDPNVSRDSINPVIGDFNGDALTDLGVHNSNTGGWEIALSNKGVFENAVDWLTGLGTSKDWQPLSADFNGDGKSDAAVYNNTTGVLKVALSSGSGFSDSGTWLTASFAGYSWQPVVGNFNGDKFADFALYNKDTGEIKTALGTGASFSEFTSWAQSMGQDYIAYSADFNADSLGDVCLFKKTTGEFKIVFSNTESFVDPAVWITGYAANKDAVIADFNNDGLPDIGWWENSGTWHYAVSTGSGFNDKGAWLSGFGTSSDDSATTGDFNGDGITDAAVFDKDQPGITRWTTMLSTTGPIDLLTEIDNGIGGKTAVTYTYAAESDNPGLPFPVYVTQSVSLTDTMPAGSAEETYTQTFSYSGGYFDWTDREFRGFAKVTVTDPITDNRTETYFYQGSQGQDGALKGQIEKITAYDGLGQQISEVVNTYQVRTAGPSYSFLGFPALTEVTATVWEENQNPVTTKDTFTYDNIGNVVTAVNEGDTSVSGDEKYLYTTYNQAYDIAFNRPSEVILKDSGLIMLSRQNFEYDSRGNMTKEISWLHNPITMDDGLLTMDYTYDSFGNVTSVVNPRNAQTTTQYETTFYAYPESVTNDLGHTVTYVYDPKFGVVTQTTDPNGLVTESDYDTLGRLTSSQANGLIRLTQSYPDFNATVTTDAAGLTTTSYIDGLGRNYKTVSSGEDDAMPRQVVTETFYNNRGLVDRQSLPHYIDEQESNISRTRFEYDLRGRVKKTISDYPGTSKDSQSTINYITPLYAETTDPNGNRKGVRKDVDGNNVEIIEFSTTGVHHTYYQYDQQNNLIQVTDAQGNVTSMVYDSLGRKIKMTDPDMGVWSYEYDSLGNLVKQTDALGQALEFEYDGLNRLVRKFSGASDLATYEYDSTSKDYGIGRLSKVTDQSGDTEFYYDILGREIKTEKTVGATTYTVERSYDNLDRLTSLKYPDGEIVNYTYDSNSGLLESVAGNSTYANDLQYNATSQLKKLYYGNGVRTTYSYGADQRLSQILTQNSGATVTYQNLYYNFDLNGNIETLTDNLASNIRSFTYDDLDRLTRAENVPDPSGGYQTINYQYNAIGNLIYKSDIGVLSYDDPSHVHAVTQAGAKTYSHDLNGNQLTAGSKTYTYNVENRLATVVDGLTTETYVYGSTGQRVKKTVDDGSTVSETIYIGGLYEIDGGVIKKHIFAGEKKICTVEPDHTYYVHSDHLGSSNVITDENANQVSKTDYEPYGQSVLSSGTDITSYKFTGKELDQTELYYYGARYYDPEIGRFTQPDTIVQAPFDPQTLNRYSYCRNNPLKYIDPSGHRFSLGGLLGGIGRAIGGVLGTIGNAISGIANGITGGNSNNNRNGASSNTSSPPVDASSEAANTREQSISYKIGQALGSIISAPFKAVGSVVGGVAKGVGNLFGNNQGQNQQESEPWGKFYLQVKEGGGTTGVAGSGGGWGHAWGSFEDLEGNQKTHGWWPLGASPKKTILGKKYPGRLTSEEGLDDINDCHATASHSWDITVAQYEKGKEYMDHYVERNSWCLISQCADFAVGLARSMGIEVPYSVTFPISDPNRVGKWLHSLQP